MFRKLCDYQVEKESLWSHSINVFNQKLIIFLIQVWFDRIIMYFNFFKINKKREPNVSAGLRVGDAVALIVY